MLLVQVVADQTRQGSEARSAVVVAEEAALERRWVISDQTNKLRREASRLGRMPAYRWKCGCGWAHGLSIGYRFVTAEQATAHEGSFCNGGCDLT